MFELLCCNCGNKIILKNLDYNDDNQIIIRQGEYYYDIEIVCACGNSINNNEK
jgi:hypothetical protein